MITAHTVGCQLVFDVTVPVQVVLSIAPGPRSGRVVTERLDVVAGGGRPEVRELVGSEQARLHVLRAGVGRLSVDYLVTVERSDDPLAASAGLDLDLDLDQLVYLRPSRYCPSDHVVGLAAGEFGHLSDPLEIARSVTAYVHQRVAYVSGVSGVNDSAEDTLLTGQGVCRDFAHLVVVLCRALEVPARFAAVYAPGLMPMDFHAVAETWADGRWWAWDATGLAPRPSLLRIATGRDAADTAFATTLRGRADLVSSEVTAVVAGVLPADAHSEALTLP